MAQNPKERFWPEPTSVDVVILETSSAFETGLWHLVYEGKYRRLLNTKLFRTAQVITACVQ